MQTFSISPLNMALAPTIQHLIDTKTKPLDALGYLETTALRIALIQQTAAPALTKPAIVVFAGDHGITEEPVSAFPRDVTWQMVQNFLHGGAGINVFARQHQIALHIVNAGVDHDFGDIPDLINLPVGNGTKNMLYEPAMTDGQRDQCIASGASVVQDIRAGGCTVIGFGEMGIGNTSAATLIMSALCSLPLKQCVGRGSGVNETQLAEKLRVLTRAKATHGAIHNPLEVLRTYGGFEIAMMVGAYLQAAELGMIILVDGFIATAALLVASALHPEVLQYCIFSHASDEHGHAAMLTHLKATPLLRLHLRLGEGTGVALAYPLVESAVRFLQEMASFESAAVSDQTLPVPPAA